MLRWIESRQWLPEILLSLVILLAASLPDYLLSGTRAGILSAAMALSLLLLRVQPWISLGLIASLALAAAVLGEPPLIGGLAMTAVVFWVSFAASRGIRRAALLASLIFSATAVLTVAFRSGGVGEFYGLSFAGGPETVAGVVAAVLVIWLANLSAWLWGGLHRLRSRHVGTPADLAWLAFENQRLENRAALSDERLLHTREVLQQLLVGSSAIALQAEAGGFAAKREEAAGQRALAKLAQAGRSQIGILRRLEDELEGELGQSPRLGFDLTQARRAADLLSQRGHRVSWRESGEPFVLGDFAQRILFRIIFEGLSNLERHTPAGSEANLELAWNGDSLQLLIKDNGLRDRSATDLGDDLIVTAGELQATGTGEAASPIELQPKLSHEVTGPGIRGMQRMAKTLGGQLSVTRIEGVGFSVMGIFPGLRELGAPLPGIEA